MKRNCGVMGKRKRENENKILIKSNLHIFKQVLELWIFGELKTILFSFLPSRSNYGLFYVYSFNSDQHLLKWVFALLQSLSQKLKNPCKYLEFTINICLVVLFIKALAQ